MNPCRRDGVWGGPAAIRFGGGSLGAQIGGESPDVVMLVMNRDGMEKPALDKFTIGRVPPPRQDWWDEPARRTLISCCTPRFCRTPEPTVCSQASRSMGPWSAGTTAKTANFMDAHLRTRSS
jgi:hypothetical protein